MPLGDCPHFELPPPPSTMCPSLHTAVLGSCAGIHGANRVLATTAVVTPKPKKTQNSPLNQLKTI